MVNESLKMAESVRDKVIGNSVPRSPNENSGNIECAVCLQPSVHPAELPCGHIFCYLCIKGIVNQGRRCAMCRQDIPANYLEKPRLLKPVDLESINHGFEDGHLWFYEGHNGWWQYDERTSLELETAYQKGERCCELLIAGFLYTADFDSMLQYRRNDPSRRRRIKRDLATTSKKGVAGLKPTKNYNTNISAPEVVSNELIQSLPISGQSILDTIDSMRLLHLSEGSSGTLNQPNPELRSRNRSLSTPNVTCNTSSSVSNTNTQPESDDTFFMRNFDLDSIIHDTLDWTIEQIESLNLELLNDYEILFRGVNSYDRLHDNVGRNRGERPTSNYFNQLPNTRLRLNRSLENELDSNSSMPSLPEPRVPPPGTSSAPSQDVTPQPPPRTRSSRIRSRVMSPRRSTSLNRETLF